MNLYDFAYFQVSVKAIITKDDDILLLITNGGYYDFPGGRMDEPEVDLSLHEVLTRELTEELGSNFKFDIGNIAFVAKRRYHKDNKEQRILATFFAVRYKSGVIELSNEHAKSKWIKPKSILDGPEKFISIDEYTQYKNYCETRL